MGSKIGTILSIFIIFFAFMFGVDVVLIQLNYSNLDSLSTYISYKISKEAQISADLKKYAEENYHVYLIEVNPDISAYKKGDIFEYYLSSKYQPLIMAHETININIKRYAVISIYN
ncbi:MAG TPA: hypothetical protein VJY64_00995 [Candidatus Onthovivens sp.]|nr:hypothetical protein [Candidatus Onthovivens sp.]